MEINWILVVTYICAGIHHSFMHNIGVSELQHLSGDRKDFAGDISSSWALKNMPGSGLWLYTSA